MPQLTRKTDIDAMVAAARKAGAIAFDCETTGLEWQKHKCFAASICFDGETGYYVRGDEALAALGPLLGDPHVVKYAHNAKFDLHHLRQAGLTVRGQVYDTEVMARLANENRPNYKLKDLCATFYGVDAKEEQDALKAYMKERGLESYDGVPDEIMAPYACQDAVLCFRMATDLLADLKAQDQTYDYPDAIDTLLDVHEREAKVMRIAEQMERIGHVVDLTFLEEYKETLAKRAAELKEELVKMVGDPTFNPESDQQVGKAMLSFGWIPTEKTKEGAPKVDKYALEGWDHPFSALLMEHRRCCKVISTYCEGIASRATESGIKYLTTDGAVHKCGILHADFRTNGTVTGRFSCTNPNMQNFDKKSEARAALVARPGYTNFYLDFKQIEICGFAYYAGDKIMQDTLWEGEDYHKLNAMAMYDVPAEAVTPDMRTKAKTFNFALLYGAGEKKIAKMLKVDQAEAGMYKKRYMDRFPSVRKLRWRCENAIRTRGFVINRFGRRRRLSSDDCYKSMNALIQSWAADLLKEALVRVADAIQPYEADLLLQIHDELVIQIKDGPEQGAALKAAMDAMTSVGELVNTVPIRVDVSASKTNWHEEKELDADALHNLYPGVF